MGSATISWSSTKQATVALSSTEAEYRGAAIATCEEVWIRRFLADFGEYIDGEVTIWCDNISNIQLANVKTQRERERVCVCVCVKTEREI